jgi:hypothetical protein
MTRGPWGTEPRTAKAKAQAAVRSPLGRFAGTALVVSALFGVVLYGKYETDRSSDAKRMPTSAYNDLVVMTRVCPIMRRPIRLAMADGFLTQGEAKSLRRTADARQKAYAEAEARNAAAKASGAPAIPVPPECTSTSSLLTLFETSD